MNQPEVSVVIPVFNQIHFTKLCLETLLGDPDRPDYEILVIDNGSEDGTADYLRAEAARINAAGRDRLVPIINPENRGVAPAWNQGLLASHGRYIAVLNNDLHLTPGWMKNCLWALDHHKLALVSPFAGTRELNYDLAEKTQTFTKVNRGKLWNSYDFCAVVMPRSTYETLGLFDENFLVGGYEDTDYAYRMKEKGMRYAVSGAAYIHHFGSQTLGEFKKRGDKHAAHNKDYFIKKWGEDPSHFAGTLQGKALKWWRNLKMRFGRM